MGELALPYFLGFGFCLVLEGCSQTGGIGSRDAILLVRVCGRVNYIARSYTNATLCFSSLSVALYCPVGMQHKTARPGRKKKALRKSLVFLFGRNMAANITQEEECTPNKFGVFNWAGTRP